MSQPSDPKAALRAAIEAQFDDYAVQHPGKMTGFNIAALITIITKVVSATPAIMALVKELVSIFKNPNPPGPQPVPGSAPVGAAPDPNASSLQP